ncbi:hypothetical protein PC116_g15080 [Phytophthora cactorum]|uniref:Uncharacterized protein n=1 Tax=Phytophthora cactorum TaxID=29920 RepID=A0A329SL33_9STRA|nr:hypothetical protein Pcac1_g4799 [Phytophthora cactorum]KAG2887214.1 hypothetical protein PC114_g18895 [Phytophthora cactorum]KAG2892143.1 hypothetical protein PC117_g24075 [Phytophthora cactorum]KAG2970193.1 hypothetical protein PC119_g23708 [Phytophthora cactorum]KAG3009320.1 hypothetical protein PC120_g15691 [Phytophthora cactorum]
MSPLRHPTAWVMMPHATVPVAVDDSVAAAIGLKSLQTDVDSSDSEPRDRVPSLRPTEERYHVFVGETDRRVKATGVQLKPLPKVAELLNLEGLKAEYFLAELMAREITEMVLLRRVTTVEELNSSSVTD